MSLSRSNSRRRLISIRSSVSRFSESRIPSLVDIDAFINGGFEADEASISAIDDIFVPPSTIDESTLTEEEGRRERRSRRIAFTLGCLMAFTSGLTLTVNNFIVKEFSIDFGEIMAVRGLMQIPVMLTIIAFQGKLKQIIPDTLALALMTISVGIFGGFTMLATFACVKFMPVGDAMTLIFTNPLFTMIFAAIFLGHRLTLLKNVSALVLMAGIILVTKPPFIFSQPEGQNVTSSDELLNMNFVLYDFKISNWSLQQQPTFYQDPEKGDYYFVGALIALSQAIFSACNNIIIAKIGNRVPITVLLFYIGVGGLLTAFLCQLIDENDRFFSSSITEIPLKEIGVALGVGCIGLSGFFCTTRSLTMIPPSTVATLRTSQIFVAFIAQALIMQLLPSVLDIVGALSIFLASLVITFEKSVYKCIMCRSSRA